MRTKFYIECEKSESEVVFCKKDFKLITNIPNLYVINSNIIMKDNKDDKDLVVFKIVDSLAKDYIIRKIFLKKAF